jgi:hypothetical protein
VAVAREDRDAVAVLMLAGQEHGFLEILGTGDPEDGDENLFLVRLHVGGDVIE